MILVVLGAILGFMAIGLSLFFHNNLNWNKSLINSVWEAGFIEKQLSLPDGDIINYAEGGQGTPLLLIHGQGVSWKDYMEVLPDLSKEFHVFAVDCHGHGKSTHNSEKYSAELIGKDFTWFIENVIKQPVILSGHSSGGLISAWLAANSPQNIIQVVLEDPPLFSSEKSRLSSTFAYVDMFRSAHNFVNQDKESDFVIYYLENCKWLTYFGDLKNKILESARESRLENPKNPIKISYLPPSMTRMIHFLDDYDPRFGNAFYNSTWMENFDHGKTLERIKKPTILIHNNWSYDDENILLGAMDDKDANKACKLIESCKYIKIDSGHDSHAEKPREFVKILIDILKD